MEHHLHMPAVGTHGVLIERGDIDAVEHHAAVGRFNEAQDEFAHCRLAAAGFADQAQGLAGLD